MNATKKELTDKEYIDILNDIYPNVNICGYVMFQGDILLELNPIAFNQAKLCYEDGNMPYVCEACNTEFNDLDEANDCCKIDRLIELLGSLGYTGIDASIEESLICYGIVYNESTEHVIICNNTGDDTFYQASDLLFGTASISKDDIKESIEDQGESYFDYLGITKREYTIDSIPLVTILHDDKSYNGLLTGDIPYNISIDDIINLLTNLTKGVNNHE